MWSYYGAKTNIIHLYPRPMYDKIIEPFAGTARYSLRFFDRNIHLVDKYPVIIRIWKWLQQCSENDIKKLPTLKKGQSLNDFTFDCEEAKLLMGFLIAKAVERPRINPTDRVVIHRPNFTRFSLNRIAANLFKIRHWVIELGDYQDITNQKATWFIDPPYQHGGAAYVMNNKKIDFEKLGEWSKSRKGQVIVCESSKADWLPFKSLAKQKGSIKYSNEAMWSNEIINTSTQKELFN
jgi:site-specific DNA-adenine methylase